MDINIFKNHKHGFSFERNGLKCFSPISLPPLPNPQKPSQKS